MDKRIHFVDQMRSHMMLLGLVLHVAASYNTDPAAELWPYKDEQAEGLFTLITAFIHGFRMQVFFLVAGFFAGLLIHTKGLATFARNRHQRLLVPFLLFLLPISALCHFLFRHAASIMAERHIEIAFEAPLPLYHLWFLYYLLLYSLAAIPLAKWLAPLAEGDRIRRAVPMVLLVVTLLQASTYWHHGSYLLRPPAGLAVVWETFVHYGLFFCFGLIGYFGREGFFSLFSSTWRWLALTFLSWTLFSVAVSHAALTNPDHPQEVVWYGCLFLAIYSVGICGTIFALYQRWLDRFSRVGRYLSEASYWIYLVHLPLALAFAIAMDEWSISVYSKFVLNVSLVFVVSVVSYQLLVRSTVVGQLLNGRRHVPALRHSRLGV